MSSRRLLPVTLFSATLTVAFATGLETANSQPQGQSIRDDCINIQSSPMTVGGQVVNGEIVLSLTNNCGTAVQGMMTWSNGLSLGFRLGAGEIKPHWYTQDAVATAKYYVCAAPSSPVAPSPDGGSPAGHFINYSTPRTLIRCE